MGIPVRLKAHPFDWAMVALNMLNFNPLEDHVVVVDFTTIVVVVVVIVMIIIIIIVLMIIIMNLKFVDLYSQPIRDKQSAASRSPLCGCATATRGNLQELLQIVFSGSVNGTKVRFLCVFFIFVPFVFLF